MKIAIMGFGVVGSGVGELVSKNQSVFKAKTGEGLEIKHILDLRDFPDSEYKCFTKDFNDILNDTEVEAVVEVMGGVNPAYDFTKKLLLAGKHVISSNKELVAKHGTELLAIAREKNINYLFEASVGGGIPIIRPLYSSLTSDEISGIYGILNGTTNYILTRMINDGVEFSDALSDAQAKGYAEKDPTADVDGLDACRKIAILTSLAFGKSVDAEKIPTEGIRNITLTDVAYAEKLNSSIKLIGSCVKAEDGVFARVCPMLIPSESPLSCINDVFNGIVVTDNSLGEVMFYGKGAGKLPTASAVISDVIDIVKHKNKNIVIRWEQSEDGYLKDGSKQKYSYYLRIKNADKNVFSSLNLVTLDGKDNEFAIVTPKLDEKELEAFLNEDRFDSAEVLAKLRML